MRHAAVTALAASSVAALAAACASYRIEYHDRPGFYDQAAAGELPDRVTLDDGTVIVYRQRDLASRLAPADEDAEHRRRRIRQENDDGTVELRASVPQDVLANTLICIRNNEYELLWEQMVSEQTKQTYEDRGEGVEEFTAFCTRNRNELAATLTRMLMGFVRQEAVMENAGPGLIHCRFYPHIGSQFKFRTVEIVAEDGQMRLLMIR